MIRSTILSCIVLFANNAFAADATYICTMESSHQSQQQHIKVHGDQVDISWKYLESGVEGGGSAKVYEENDKILMFGNATKSNAPTVGAIITVLDKESMNASARAFNPKLEFMMKNEESNMHESEVGSCLKIQ